MNKVILIGNVGADPEVKEFSGGKVVKLRIATTERYKNKNGEKQEKTQWHNVDVWREALQGVVESYVKKGDRISVVGSIEYKENDGKWYTTIMCNEVHLLGSSEGSPASKPRTAATPQPVANSAESLNSEEDSLPF